MESGIQWCWWWETDRKGRKSWKNYGTLKETALLQRGQALNTHITLGAKPGGTCSAVQGNTGGAGGTRLFRVCCAHPSACMRACMCTPTQVCTGAHAHKHKGTRAHTHAQT